MRGLILVLMLDVCYLTVILILILTEKSMKKTKKHINRDLKLVVQRIRANRLSLNTGKTELVIFKSKNKNITKHLSFRISVQKIKLFLPSQMLRNYAAG